MDSEVTNLAQVKAFDATDYATAAQGTTADAALPKAGGTMTGTIAGFTSTGIDDNATSTAITIDASENVGIGTSSPSSKLEINIGGDQTQFEINKSRAGDEAMINLEHTTTNRGSFIRYANATDSWKVGMNGAEDFVFETSASLTGNGTEQVRFLDSGGITFNGDTAAANALDDYEASTYTPAWQNITVGNGTNTGTYVKVGNVVTVTANLILGSTSVVGSNVNVSLPFTNTGLGSAGSGRLRVGSITYPAWGELTAGQTVLWFKVLFSGSTILVPSTISATNPGTWTTGDAMHLTITYVTA
jgi:hypothetical protein